MIFINYCEGKLNYPIPFHPGQWRVEGSSVVFLLQDKFHRGHVVATHITITPSQTPGGQVHWEFGVSYDIQVEVPKIGRHVFMRVPAANVGKSAVELAQRFDSLPTEKDSG